MPHNDYCTAFHNILLIFILENESVNKYKKHNERVRETERKMLVCERENTFRYQVKLN